MQTRRNFIGNVATGLAGTIATGKVLGASDRVRLGIIGAGDRGTQLAREAASCPNTEIAAFADVYSRRLEEAARLAPARTCADYRRLIEDPAVDAVVIATPQHLHAEAFVAAMEARKPVYIEKAMAFTVDHAKQMRGAWENAGRPAVQVGHQVCSSGHVVDAGNFLAGGTVGQITAIRSHFYRNTPHGKPQWFRPAYPDMTPDTVDWNAFLGGAPAREFDAHRFTNWRYFWDYSGGGVHENMSQQLAFWYKTMALNIPAAVTMTGGIYRWKDGREVPDTMAVSMEHDDLLFTWNSAFGNNQPGIGEDVLGTEGTIARGQQIRYFPQRVTRPDGAELIGQTPTLPRAHMQDFLDAIRMSRQPACPFELGFRVSVACHLAAESYLQSRTVYWDAAREEIV